jgi:hypothetical protein
MTQTLPTDFGFAGQREQGTIGLYDYHARFYNTTMLPFRVRHFAIVLLFLATISSTGCSQSRPPSDESLIESFESNRRDFEALVKMMKEDTEEVALHTVAKGYVQYLLGEEATINEQRLLEYRGLLDRLGLSSISHYAREKESFQITAYARGWSPEGGTYKGYEYFVDGFPSRLDSSLVERLDYDPQTFDSGTYLYSKIDDNWYLWLLY